LNKKCYSINFSLALKLWQLLWGKYKTLNSNISGSRQNIENLDGSFWAIHVRIMYANFQATSFASVGGGWGDKTTHPGCQAFLNRSLFNISKNFSLALLRMDNWKVDFSFAEFSFGKLAKSSCNIPRWPSTRSSADLNQRHGKVVLESKILHYLENYWITGKKQIGNL